MFPGDADPIVTHKLDLKQQQFFCHKKLILGHLQQWIICEMYNIWTHFPHFDGLIRFQNTFRAGKLETKDDSTLTDLNRTVVFTSKLHCESGNLPQNQNSVSVSWGSGKRTRFNHKTYLHMTGTFKILGPSLLQSQLIRILKPLKAVLWAWRKSLF